MGVLSNIEITPTVLYQFAVVQCPRFEVVKWNNNSFYPIKADGEHLSLMDNPREIHSEHCYFLFPTEIKSCNNNNDNDHDNDDNDNNTVSNDEAISKLKKIAKHISFYRLFTKLS